MNYVVYDPRPYANEYASKMFFHPMMAYARDNDIRIEEISVLDNAKNVNVFIITDRLSEERILQLKNNGCHIFAFNVTDSSYFSNGIRYAPSIHLIDKIFMVSGIATTNDSLDFVVEPDFTIKPVASPFLSSDEWVTYTGLAVAGKLESLPYVPWEPIPDIPWTPWEERSKKVILRGGGHSRRIILAMFLMRLGKLDCNSGMVLTPYFSNHMDPAFRFCDNCRSYYKQRGNRAVFSYEDNIGGCTSPARADRFWDLSNLGHWNNRCPNSFYWMAIKFGEKYGRVDMNEMETLLNAKWISDKDHQQMLGRIAFTSDLKWIHSIYAPQRFWQAAAAGCLNILPERTNDQCYFPEISDGTDYLTFSEQMDILDHDFGQINEALFNHITSNVRMKYEQWIRPTKYAISTNLLQHIFAQTT